MKYKVLDVVMNPDLIDPEGTELPNIVGEEAITLMDVLTYGLIFIVCAGLVFLVFRKIRMIKNENI